MAAEVHVRKGNLQARDEADVQPAADAEFHPHGLGSDALQPWLGTQA